MAGRQDVRRLLALEAADRRGILGPKQQMALRVLEERMGNRDPLEGVKAAGETAMTIGTSAIAEPLSGLVGLAATPFGSDVATRAIERAQQGLTYEPRSERSQGQMQDIGESMKPVGDAFIGASQYLGDAAYEATGSPALGAAAYSAPTAALELLGLNIARRLPGKKYQMGDIGKRPMANSQRGAVSGVRGSGGTVENLPSSSRELMAKLRNQGIETAIGESADSLRLNKIVVPPALRNQGAGTQAMKEIMEYADQTGKRIDLSPTSDFGGNTKRLREFYERQGFVRNRGDNRNFEVSEEMYREPSVVGGEVDPSYRGVHTAPVREGANSLDDMSDIYPDDIYDSSVAGRFYGHAGGDALDRKTARIISKFAGNPDADVTIYRAVPKGVDEINPGDWITVNPDYAKQHGGSWVDDGNYDIISKKVKAKDVVTDGNSIHEFGYDPEK